MNKEGRQAGPTIRLRTAGPPNLLPLDADTRLGTDFLEGAVAAGADVEADVLGKATGAGQTQGGLVRVVTHAKVQAELHAGIRQEDLHRVGNRDAAVGIVLDGIELVPECVQTNHPTWELREVPPCGQVGWRASCRANKQMGDGEMVARRRQQHA